MTFLFGPTSSIVVISMKLSLFSGFLPKRKAISESLGHKESFGVIKIEFRQIHCESHIAIKIFFPQDHFNSAQIHNT